MKRKRSLFGKLVSKSPALYVVSVRQTKVLLTASFRFYLAIDTLAVRLVESQLWSSDDICRESRGKDGQIQRDGKETMQWTQVV